MLMYNGKPRRRVVLKVVAVREVGGCSQVDFGPRNGRRSEEGRNGRTEQENVRKKAKKGKKRKEKPEEKLPFFKLMLDAKKKGLASFKYNGKTYKGRKHKRLGMIYKKA